MRTLIENLDTVKYPNRYVNIYYVDTVNNTHKLNCKYCKMSSLKRELGDLRRARKVKGQKKISLGLASGSVKQVS